MAARSSWKGALELAGFPVIVRLYPRVKSRAGDSLKLLAPTDNKPVRRVYIDSEEEIVEQSECGRGVMIGSGKSAQIHPLSDDAVASIAAAEKSTLVTPRTFVPLEQVPLELATQAYTVIPDPESPGAEKSVSLVWNGLHAEGLAYMTEATFRAGSRDAILAVYAGEDGLRAVTLPFAVELHDPPVFTPEVDGKQADVFARGALADYPVRDFTHTEYESTWRERRAQAIEAALAGKPVEMPEAPDAPSAGPDLEAILEAAAKQDKPKPKAKAAKKRPAKKRSKTKAAV